MLKYFIGLILIAAAWAAWFFLELHLAIPIAVTVLVLLAIVALVVFERLRARQRAQHLEQALTDQAQKHSQGVRPDLQAEIHEMQAEFQKAIAALKTSKLGRGSDAMYALPWYVIIGPPGAGKSTALRNSGLQFPYLSSSGGGIRGIGGTRNCDWWLTNDAVILDTAGRWTTEHEDQDEWLAFLDLVKRFRPRKPLNGLLVAVAVTELASAHEQQIQVLAGQVRERIDEVMERLEMSLPVYVLFTKCDLLPGFVETFGDMTKADRGQIWGFTAPVSKPMGEPAKFFGERFDELAYGIEGRVLKRMTDERRVDARARVFAFPQQFEILRRNLSDFVGLLFQENVFKETPYLRGAYFTSGTQEGRPIDLVMARMADAMGVAQQITAAEPVVEQKSYFLRDVFSDVIFPDREMAVRSAAELSRQRRTRYVLAAAIFGLALIVSSVPGWSFLQNRAFLGDIDEVVTAAAPHLGGEGLIDVGHLEPLRQETQMLEDSPSVLMRFGMYQGERVHPAMRALFADAFRRKVLQPIWSAEASALGDFGRRYEVLGEQSHPTPEEYREHYERLRAYLLITTPRADSEPALDPELERWLSDRLVGQWATMAQVPEGDGRRASMVEATRLFLAIYRDRPQLALPRDTEAVQRVRTALDRVPFADLALSRIVFEIDEAGSYDLGFLQLVGSDVRSIQSSERVKGAFTRRAFEERVSDRLSQPVSSFTGDPWVLGRATDASAARQAEDLQTLSSLYFQRYEQEWHRFIQGVTVTEPPDDQAARATLAELIAGSPTPLGRFLRQVQYNTRLPVPDEGIGARGQAAAQAGLRGIQARLQKNQATQVVGRVVRGAGEARLDGEGGDAPGADPSFRVYNVGSVRNAFSGLTDFGVAPAVREGETAQKTGLDHYIEQLEFVLDAMVDDSGVAAKVRVARTQTRQIIGQQDDEWQDTLGRWLWPPLRGQR